MSMTTVSTTQGLLSALKAAHAGDTILLAPGTYSSVNIYNFHPTGTIYIASASSTNHAVLTDLSVKLSSALKFSNLTFATTLTNDPTSYQAPTPFQVQSSVNIAFNQISVHGTMDNNPQDDVNGFRIQNSANVTITNSTFQQLFNAITELNNTNIVISNNSIHDIRNDGIDNGGSSNVVLSGNAFTNFYPVGQVGGTGDHADAIQFWTSNTTADTSNIVVTNNSFLRGSGSYVQGIFITDQVGLHYHNVTVTGNTIVGGEYNGITVQNGIGVNVSNNTVEGYTGIASWIKLQDSSNITLNTNVANSVNLIGTNTFTSQLYNQMVGLVQSVSTLAATPISVVAEVGHVSEYGPSLAGNALASDTGTSLYLADVGVGAAAQQQVASGGSTFNGTYGTLTVNPNGSYTYVESKIPLTAGVTYDDHFTLTVAGAKGGAQLTTLDIIVSGAAIGDGNVDNLVAGSGAQTLSGFGAGSTLTSGSGADTFAFTSLASSTPTTQTVIQHFKAGDIIDLSAIDPSFQVVSKFDGHAHELVLAHLGTGNWEIYGDTTGSGTANFAIHLLGMSSTYVMSAADFHL